MDNIEKVKKTINIIYYVNTNKTKAIRMSYLSFISLITASCMVLLWSVVSIFFIGNCLNTINKQKEKILVSNDVIFDYQMKYDKVLEGVYTQKVTSDKDSSSTTSNNKKNSTELTKQQAGLPVPQAHSTENNSSSSLSAKSLSDSAVAEVTDSKTSNLNAKGSILLEHVGTFKQDKTITTLINLSNTTERKISGKVWGVAYYKKTDGSVTKVFYPDKISGFDTNATQVSQAPHGAVGYNIKHFKQQKMQFKRPVSNGSFVKFEVYVTDDKNFYKKYFNVDESKLKFRTTLNLSNYNKVEDF